MDNNKRKILLIVTEGYEFENSKVRIDNVSWENIKLAKNFTDFDIIIFDLLNYNIDFFKYKFDWYFFNHQLDFFTVLKYLNSNGQILIIGDPRFEWYSNKFLNWTGLYFDWDNKPGDTVIINKEYKKGKYSNYLKYLKEWDYSLKYVNISQDIKKIFSSNKNILEIECEDICLNRNLDKLVFSISYKYSSIDSFEVTTSNPIIFLPKISLSVRNTLEIIFNDIFSIDLIRKEPPWIKDIKVIGQGKIEKIINVKDLQIKRLNKEKNILLKEKEKAREYLKLLYEKEYTLEPLVRNVLRELGAKVEDPIEKNKEDGWLKIYIDGNCYRGVLEIKSTTSECFNERGRKQLLDWKNRGIELKGEKFKGIFIGNYNIAKPPEDRPLPFSDNWINSAKLSEIVALTTVDLFKVYESFKRNELNVNKFWVALFKTNGLLNIAPLIEKKKI